MMARIAEDNDFDHLKQLVDDYEGWILELDKADTKVWTRPIDGCSFQMVSQHKKVFFVAFLEVGQAIKRSICA
jgi:N-acetylglutamate synthase-like GNAT family acetyltransferase